MTRQSRETVGEIAQGNFTSFLHDLADSHVYGVVRLIGDDDKEVALTFVDGQIASPNQSLRHSRLARIELSQVLHKLASDSGGFAGRYRIEPIFDHAGVHKRETFLPFALLPDDHQPAKGTPPPTPPKRSKPAETQTTKTSTWSERFNAQQASAEQRKARADEIRQRRHEARKRAASKATAVGPTNPGEKPAVKSSPSREKPTSPRNKAPHGKPGFERRRPSSTATPTSAPAKDVNQKPLARADRTATSPVDSNQGAAPSPSDRSEGTTKPDRRSALKRLIQTLSS